MAIKKGERGTHVVLLQGILQKLDYSITSDGIFGDATLEAVRDFQTKSGIDVDGAVGEETAYNLVKALHFGVEEIETV